MGGKCQCPEAGWNDVPFREPEVLLFRMVRGQVMENAKCPHLSEGEWGATEV